MDEDELLALFPARSPAKRRACCSWEDFTGGFVRAWDRHAAGENPPSYVDVDGATKDWQQGNTGYEAMKNCIARRRERGL